MESSDRDIGYYDNPREEILALLNSSYEKSLDVGCGRGRFSLGLKNKKVVKEAHGVELFPEAQAEASKHLDHVFAVDLSHEPPPPQMKEYDLVLCLDVLEHMIDPWAALKKIRSTMKPGATLIVSLPNVRNFRVVLPLLLRGDWRYEKTGLLDSTHIRFFTKKTGLQMLKEAGFEMKHLEATGGRNFSITWWVNLFSLGILRPFIELQYLIVAVKPLQQTQADTRFTN